MKRHLAVTASFMLAVSVVSSCTGAGESEADRILRRPKPAWKHVRTVHLPCLQALTGKQLSYSGIPEFTYTFHHYHEFFSRNLWKISRRETFPDIRESTKIAFDCISIYYTLYFYVIIICP